MLLCGSHRRSKSTAVVSTGRIFLHTKTSMFGCSPIQINIGGFFAHIASPDRWGKTGVEFITLSSPKKSGETTNTVILITDGVGESDLGLVMVFCHPNQARIEACDALSTLCHHDSSEPSVVVVRRYSNTPYVPRGMSNALHLDIGSFFGGIASTQFL